MRTVIIPLDSYTDARRAVRYLSSHGIRAHIEKTGSGRGGCAFGIRTDESPARVCSMLAEIRVRCGQSMPVPPPPPPRPPRPPFRRRGR